MMPMHKRDNAEVPNVEALAWRRRGAIVAPSALCRDVGSSPQRRRVLVPESRSSLYSPFAKKVSRRTAHGH